MASILIQLSKYLIMFLFLAYLFGCFYVFRLDKKGGKQKIVYVIQRILIFAIHLIGYLCLYQMEEDIQLIGFYLMQVVLISGIMALYHGLYKKSSVLLINNMCMLIVISMIMLSRLSFDQAFRQFVFLTVGSIIMLLIPLFLKKGSVFRKFTVIYCVLGILLLGLVVLIGSTSYGAKLNLSIFGISFQPSEFVKILFVFFIAAMLYKDHSIKRVIQTGILSAVFVLLLAASRDLGGALLYFAAFVVMVYVATSKKVYLILGAVGMSGAAVAGYFLFSHVRTRVFAWLDPLADVNDKGYQICQSLFGIGTGGWFGFGIGEGLPHKIPIVEKDFIFSAIAEEFGVIFGIGLIVLCLSCFMLFVNVANRVKDRFYKLVAIGFATLYAVQVILTIGGAIKFIPSTGVTLPLVSYGGSSLLSTLFIFGIIQGLYMRKSTSTGDKPLKEKNAKEYNLIFYIFGTIFVAMIAYLCYFMFFVSEDFINNDYNKLQTLLEEDVSRGDIITSDGFVIAETILDEDEDEVRNYPYKNLFSHVTGYITNSKTGLEKQVNFTLLRSHAFLFQQLMCEISGEKKPGDNVIVTLEYQLQEVAHTALGEQKGAVIVMDPQTGDILTLVSKPDFDSNRISQDWYEIKEGTALYNRATQGQYTPGSIFKIFTTLAYMRCNPESYTEYSYECTGEITIDGKTIHCASGKKHGTVNLEQSFAKSCNTSYANMLNHIDLSVLQELCDGLLFNQNLPIAISSAKSEFAIGDTDTTAMKMDTLIGQGKTLVSPLHMVMLASAIANDGVAMRPNFVQEIQNYQGGLVERAERKEYQTLFTAEEVAFLRECMQATVQDGTGTKLQSELYDAYGKTGTAQISDSTDATNAWFVGFAEMEGRQLAIAVVVEDEDGGSGLAVPIAQKIFDSYFQ